MSWQDDALVHAKDQDPKEAVMQNIRDVIPYPRTPKNASF